MTTCKDSMNNPIVWTVDQTTTGQVKFTPGATLTLATGASCTLSFDEKINAKGSTTMPPNSIDWVGEDNFTCVGEGLSNSQEGSGNFPVVQCSVTLDKDVSCNGGTTFVDNPPGCVGFNAFGANPASQVEVRYEATNTGTLAATCNAMGQGLSDTNLALLPMQVGIAGPLAVSSTTTIDTVGPTACTAALAMAEPDTATLKCQCSSGAQTFIAPQVTDSNLFSCLSPQLTVTKTCGTANASGNSAVTVSYSSASKTAPLSSCTLTDKVFAGPCVMGAPSSATVVDTVANGSPVANNPTSSTQTISGLTATGLTTASCGASGCCNQATITCDLTGSPGPETFAASNVATCPVAIGSCFDRSPGFWAEHPAAQALVYKHFGPVDSCGVDLNTPNPITQGSGTEDLCSIGGGKKSQPQDSISNTQRQLERECAAANLNLAVSSIRGLDCEAADPGITDLVTMCCGTAAHPANVCNDGTQGAFNINGCISGLDVFNNMPFAGAGNADFGPPGASPTDCKAAKASGFVNKRTRP